MRWLIQDASLPCSVIIWHVSDRVLGEMLVFIGASQMFMADSRWSVENDDYALLPGINYMA